MPSMRRFVKFACLLLTLVASQPAAAAFKPLAGFDRQLFPSFILATASMRRDGDKTSETTLGDTRGLLGVEVVAPADDTPVVVEIQCSEYLEPSTFVGVLPKRGETYRVFPTVRYRYGKLARCTQTTPAAVTFRVKLGAAADETESVICTMRTVNDCPFSISSNDGDADISFTFAAYVNEQHPYVDKLLREALDGEIVDSFGGYQSDPAGVFLQAYALWDLLVQRGVQYSNITTSAAVSDTVGSQHVRMVEESVNNSEANCVDGSVLWASLLQRIGVDSFLVMEPTHCYAGFYLDAEHKHCLAIETTMLGADMSLDDVEVPESLDEAVPAELRNDDTFASFIAAVGYGTARMNASLARQNKEASDDSVVADEDETSDGEEAPPIDVIDIAAARNLGILPIPYQKGEEFVWYDYYNDDSEESYDENEADASYEEDDEDESYDDEGEVYESSYDKGEENDDNEASYDESEEDYDEEESYDE